MGSIEQAVDAMKLGALRLLQKPVDATRLRTILANAARQRETEIELEVARRRLRESGVLGGLVGGSKVMREIFSLIEQIAPSNVSVLITGESGTGKELVARTLHNLSPTQDAALCCSQIARRFRKRSLRARSSGTKRARSPELWSRPCRMFRIGFRRNAFFWMNWRDAAGERKPSFFGFWKNGSCAGWGRALSRTSMCAVLAATNHDRIGR